MKERVITGVLGAALFISMVFLGGSLFTAFIILIATVGMTELLKMKNIEPLSFNGLISLFSMWVILVPIDWFEMIVPSTITKVHLLTLAIALLLAMTVITKNRFTFDHVGFIILSSLYVGFGFQYFITVRNIPDKGMLLVFFILFLIWMTDSAAYFVGKTWGKRKLWPEISPKKTIGGAIGGICGAIIIGTIFYLIVPTLMPSYWTAFILMVIVSIFGQLGDLVQSAFKRNYQVKDSGTILPGHGGILDRFDSLLYVMIILYVLQIL